MIGGKVKRVYIRNLDSKRLSLWVVDGPDELAIDLASNLYPIMPGDSIWWQSRYAYWTPMTRDRQDVPIPRVGYSYPVETLLADLCVQGICPECGSENCMADGNGRLQCTDCGDGQDFSETVARLREIEVEDTRVRRKEAPGWL